MKTISNVNFLFVCYLVKMFSEIISQLVLVLLVAADLQSMKISFCPCCCYQSFRLTASLLFFIISCLLNLYVYTYGTNQ